jgi:tetratricopeptide (TPR) repeat protein
VLDASGRKQLDDRPTTNLQAYDYFLRAEAASLARNRQDPTATRIAIPLYRQAVTLDPSFALAWSQLARLYANNFTVSLDPADRTGAIDAANRAVELAPDKVDGYLARSTVHRLLVDDARARPDDERALAIAPNDPRVIRRQGQLAMEQGREDEGLALTRRALSLDPRSATAMGGMLTTLLDVGRFAEAESLAVASLEITPENPGRLYDIVWARLGLGDLAGARRVITDPYPQQPHRGVAIYLSIYGDFYWLLDQADQELVLTGTLDEFEGDVGSYGLVKAEISAARGDMARARAYADTGRRGFEEQLKHAPDNGQGNALLGLTLTYLDRKAEALAAIERGLKAHRSASNQWYEQDLAARVYMRLGDSGRALDQIERTLKSNGPVSRAYYRLHPVFAPLKGNPRFETLTAAK